MGSFILLQSLLTCVQSPAYITPGQTIYKEHEMFERIKLPYGYADLEPVIDKQTVEVHYDGHHKTYEDNFNKLVKDVPALNGMGALEILRSLDKVPADIRQGVRNNGGGFYNHNLYFESFTPGGAKPDDACAERIKKDFGSYEALTKAMVDAATAKLFGSGWSWLIEKSGKLEVVISANQDLPEGDCKLLLPLDMWEHAFYLKYKNKKKDYAEAFFGIVDWKKVASRLK